MSISIVSNILPALWLIVGSYSSDADEGIKVYSFDQNNGTLNYVSGVCGVSNPSFQTVTADGRHVYSVGEDNGLSSTANHLTFDNVKGELTLVDRVSTDGGSPCYINLSPDESTLFTANYMGDNISIIEVSTDGALKQPATTISFSGNGPVEGRQERPHPHCVTYTPDNRFLLVDDLGTDAIHMFELDDAQRPIAATRRDVELEAASGPRHIVFDKAGAHAYLINEIGGTVTVLNYDGQMLTPVQYALADSLGAQGSGDIHLSPDGRFLYASNRLQGDGIAIFAVNESDGAISKVGYQDTGRHPRNFAISPNGRYLLVACRDDNAIEVYRRDAESGMLYPTEVVVNTPKPVCLTFLNRQVENE